jgi:hypothetical protein
MSKATVKKLLTSMPKEDLIRMVLEMYDARKEAKEYLEFYVNPDEDRKLEEYKKIIIEEFYPVKSKREPKTRFSVCRKAVSDYKKLKPSADKLANLMLCYVENACHFTYDYGDMWEQYYTSTENNFEKTMAFIAKNNLLEHFKARLEKCVEWSSLCGWGFGDAIADIFYEYFEDEE